MKIVQLLPELNEGGVERGTVELNREFTKLGHESIIISNGGKQVSTIEAEGGQHINFDVCSKNIFTAIPRIFKLRKLLKEINPDIVHVRSRVPAWLVYFANKTLNLNVVHTAHGLYSVHQYSAIMTKGERIICVSDTVKEYLIKNFHINDKHKLIPIERGVDLTYFNSNNVDYNFIKSFKEEFHLKDKYICTTVGRIVQAKDYETFIKGIAIAKRTIPNIVGLIVGGVREDKQEYFERLKALAKEYNVEKEIIFTGHQSNIHTICYLSDISISTTPMMGNVARTLVESLAMGTPVIMTTYPGLKGIVTEGENGYLIKTNDENDLANKIILAKQQIFKNIQESIPYEFTLNHMVESTINVYEELIKSKKELNA